MAGNIINKFIFIYATEDWSELMSNKNHKSVEFIRPIKRASENNGNIQSSIVWIETSWAQIHTKLLNIVSHMRNGGVACFAHIHDHDGSNSNWM